MTIQARSGGTRPGVPSGRPSGPGAPPLDVVDDVDAVEDEITTTTTKVSSRPKPGPARALAVLAPARVGKGLQAAVAMLVLLTVSLLVGVIAGYPAYRRGVDAKAEATDRDRILEVSGRFATAVLTYDYRTNLDSVKEQVLALSTGAFRDDYAAKFEDLKKVLVAAQTTSAASVRELYVGDHDDKTAKVIVVLDTSGTITLQGKLSPQVLVGRYMQLSVVKLAGGVWRVDDLQSLNLTQGQVGGGTGGATSPRTTQPAPAP